MKKMDLNIQRFNEEAASNPVAFDNMVEKFDQAIPTVNKAIYDNQDALRILKYAAGSPRLTEPMKEIIKVLNESIDGSADYFSSVNGWSDEVATRWGGLLGRSLNSVKATIDRTVLESIDEEFGNGMVGLKSYADADTFIQSLTDVSNTLKVGLGDITDAVKTADNALPEAVHNSLTNTISTNNDEILNGYSRLNELLGQLLEDFKTRIQATIDDMAAAARGNR